MGSYNVAIGQEAMYSGTQNGYSVAIGDRALRANSGGFNVAVGSGALDSITTGNFNTGIGTGAGGIMNGASSGNIILGSAAGPSGLSNNKLYIGKTPADIALIFGDFSAGTVGIGTVTPAHTLHVVGTAGLSTGTVWTLASDSRLKNIHGDYEHGLSEILKLRPVRFSYKKDNPLNLPSDHSMTGFIAQEVEKVIPEAVQNNAQGYLELNVDPIHWAVVNAVKQLYEKLMGHNTQLQAIQSDLGKLKADNERFKSDNEKLRAELNEIRGQLDSQRLPAAHGLRSPSRPVR